MKHVHNFARNNLKGAQEKTKDIDRQFGDVSLFLRTRKCHLQTTTKVPLKPSVKWVMWIIEGQETTACQLLQTLETAENERYFKVLCLAVEMLKSQVIRISLASKGRQVEQFWCIERPSPESLPFATGSGAQITVKLIFFVVPTGFLLPALMT